MKCMENLISALHWRSPRFRSKIFEIFCPIPELKFNFKRSLVVEELLTAEKIPPVRLNVQANATHLVHHQPATSYAIRMEFSRILRTAAATMIALLMRLESWLQINTSAICCTFSTRGLCEANFAV